MHAAEDGFALDTCALETDADLKHSCEQDVEWQRYLRGGQREMQLSHQHSRSGHSLSMVKAFATALTHMEHAWGC